MTEWWFLHRAGEERQRRIARDAAITEEELASAHFCRARGERKIRLAIDAAMNEA